jgi:hypothetical protein
MSELTIPTLPDSAAAIELGKKLDQVLEAFAGEQGPLLRKACGVPDHVQKLDLVVICTFLGHTLDRLSARTGRPHTEDVVQSTLNAIMEERRKFAEERGTLQ